MFTYYQKKQCSVLVLYVKQLLNLHLFFEKLSNQKDQNKYLNFKQAKATQKLINSISGQERDES